MKHGKREWRLMCICWLHNSQFIRNIAFEADPNTLINRDVYNWKHSMNFTMASDWTFEYVQHHLRNLRVSYHLIISVFKRIIEAWCFEPFLLGLMFGFFFQYLDVRNEMNMHMLIWSVPAEEQLYDENNIWNKNTRTQYKIKFKAYE